MKITDEEWPRIISTRRIVNDGGRYFGPYTSAGSAYKTLNLLNRLFPYRKCEKKITGNDEVCLYYHMHQCMRRAFRQPITPRYRQAVEGAALFLNGRGDEILEPLEEEMQQASDGWNFERAAELRDRISAVKHVLERQKIVSRERARTPTSSRWRKAPGGDAGVQVGFIRNGKILGSRVLSDAGENRRCGVGRFLRVSSASFTPRRQWCPRPLCCTTHCRMKKRYHRGMAARSSRRQGRAGRAAAWRKAGAR